MGLFVSTGTCFCCSHVGQSKCHSRAVESNSEARNLSGQGENVRTSRSTREPGTEVTGHEHCSCFRQRDRRAGGGPCRAPVPGRGGCHPDGGGGAGGGPAGTGKSRCAR